jgi:hypothetical protein
MLLRAGREKDEGARKKTGKHGWLTDVVVADTHVTDHGKTAVDT